MKDLAPIWKRVVALAIDQLIFTALGLYLLSLVASTAEISLILSNLLYLFMFLIFSSVLQILINIFFTVSYGGSLGKLLMGIKIISATGHNLTFRKAILRNYIGYFVSSLVFWLGFFWATKNPERQTWHDMLADSHVVNKNSYLSVLGIIVFVGLVFVCGFLISQTYSQIKINLPIYTGIYEDLKTELTPKKSTSDPLLQQMLETPTPVSPRPFKSTVEKIGLTLPANWSISETSAKKTQSGYQTFLRAGDNDSLNQIQFSVDYDYPGPLDFSNLPYNEGLTIKNLQTANPKFTFIRHKAPQKITVSGYPGARFELEYSSNTSDTKFIRIMEVIDAKDRIYNLVGIYPLANDKMSLEVTDIFTSLSIK